MSCRCEKLAKNPTPNSLSDRGEGVWLSDDIRCCAGGLTRYRMPVAVGTCSPAISGTKRRLSINPPPPEPSLSPPPRTRGGGWGVGFIPGISYAEICGPKRRLSINPPHPRQKPPPQSHKKKGARLVTGLLTAPGKCGNVQPTVGGDKEPAPQWGEEPVKAFELRDPPFE